MFNPYYQESLYRNQFANPLLRRRISPPLNTRSLSKDFVPRISKFIETTQRGINTYNQIIPIYKEIKPIFTKVSETGKKIYSFMNNSFTRTSSNRTNSYKANYSNSYTNQTNPSNPFFNKK